MKKTAMLFFSLISSMMGLFFFSLHGAFAQSASQRCAKEKGEIAIASCSEAIRLNPKDATAYNNRGYEWSNRGEHDRAIADFNEAIRLNPKHADGYITRGAEWSNKGDHERAIADYTEAIRLLPSEARAFYNRGNSFSAKGDNKRAIADFSKAIQLNPNYARAYNNRGFELSKQGVDDLAIADYTKAIAINPNYALAYINRGRVYERKDNLELALKDFISFRRLAPDDPSGPNAISGVEEKIKAVALISPRKEAKDDKVMNANRSHQTTFKPSPQDEASVTKVRTDSGLNCSVVSYRDGSKNIKCSVFDNGIVVSDFSANRGNCVVPRRATEQDKRDYQAWVSILSPSEKAATLDSRGFPNQLGLYALNSALQGLTSGPQNETLKKAARGYYAMVLDKRGVYKFGDVFEIALGQCNLLEYTITTNDNVWTWKN